MRLCASLVTIVLVGACGPALPSGPDASDSALDAGGLGGGAADGGPSDAGTTPGDGGTDAGATPTPQERVTAATQTAQTNPACALSELPEGFYWEIGDRTGTLASGSVAGSNTPMPTEVIAIASASKWVYATYVLQKVGSVRPSDVPALNFTDGRVFPPSSLAKEILCGGNETVGECAAATVESAMARNKFFYSAGHFQHHAATVMGLSAMNGAALTNEVSSTLMSTDMRYLQTNLAGGLNASPQSYAAMLRRMLLGEFVMSANLGSHKVCASSSCVSGAVQSPAPPDEGWNYSLGHWVEDDPVIGDHAFSSAGALGFYPWIDATKTWYGIVARRATAPGGSQGVVSIKCGRLIRQAWVTGRTVTGTTPTP